MEGTMAVVTTVAYSFAPRGWASCNGQLLSISSNTALFSLIGTTYGGDGRSNFALPNLQSRVPVGVGSSGTSVYTLGEMTGTESVTLQQQNMPAHLHSGPATIFPKGNDGQDDVNPANNYPGTISGGYAPTASPNATMPGPTVTSATIGIAGGGMPVPVLTPYTVLNYVICVYGLFPSRN